MANLGSPVSFRDPLTALRHARKTVTFTGAAGAGAVGTVAAFTITGRIWVTNVSGFCTTNLTGAGTLDLGTATSATAFLDQADATAIDANDWLTTTTSTAGTSGLATGVFVSEDMILTIGTTDVTAGVLVFDVWYYPVTDNGLLVAA